MVVALEQRSPGAVCEGQRPRARCWQHHGRCASRQAVPPGCPWYRCGYQPRLASPGDPLQHRRLWQRTGRQRETSDQVSVIRFQCGAAGILVPGAWIACTGRRHSCPTTRVECLGSLLAPGGITAWQLVPSAWEACTGWGHGSLPTPTSCLERSLPPGASLSANSYRVHGKPDRAGAWPPAYS